MDRFLTLFSPRASRSISLKVVLVAVVVLVLVLVLVVVVTNYKNSKLRVTKESN